MEIFQKLFISYPILQYAYHSWIYSLSKKFLASCNLLLVAQYFALNSDWETQEEWNCYELVESIFHSNLISDIYGLRLKYFVSVFSLKTVSKVCILHRWLLTL